MNIGIFCMVIGSAFTHALWNFATKKVSGNFIVVWLGLCTAAVSILPFSLFFVITKEITFQSLFFMLATGLVQSFYFFTLASAYREGDFSVVYPIARGLGVCGTAVIAFFFLKEHISPLGAVAIFCIIIGILSIGFTNLRNKADRKGILYSLLVGLCITTYSIIDKLGVSITHPVIYICGQYTFAALFLLLPVMKKYGRTIIEEWHVHKKYSITIGLGTLFTYLLILFAYQVERVSYISAMREVSVMIGSVLGILMLKERATIFKVLGILLIVTGIIFIKMS